jgi:hypothetical protein
VEQYAREKNVSVITPEFLDLARQKMMPGGRVIGMPGFGPRPKDPAEH